jgi:hypothetical protein
MNEFLMINKSDDSVKNKNLFKCPDSNQFDTQTISTPKGNDTRSITCLKLAEKDVEINEYKSKIKDLEQKVTDLTSLVHTMISEMRSNSKSSNCSCGKKSGDKKLVSAGTNTSLEHGNVTAEKSASNKNNSSSHQIMNINQNNSLLNSLNNHKNKQEEEDDHRYDAFLNENSINFPRQFLDMENKESESIYEESITVKNSQIGRNNNAFSRTNENILETIPSINQFLPSTNNQVVNNNYNNIPYIPKSINQSASQNNNSRNIPAMNESKSSSQLVSKPQVVNVQTTNTVSSLILEHKDSFSTRKNDYVKRYEETFGKNKLLSIKIN